MTGQQPGPTGGQPPAVVVRTWPNGPRSVGRARRLLLSSLAEWELAHLADGAALVLSELVTNSVRHARVPRGRVIETRFERTDHGVRIEVHDAGEGMPEVRTAAPDEEYGRGLALVDAITAGRWGVGDRGGVGKLVWAECAGSCADGTGR
ncbi:ATP-binding protein [Actinacidiphila epipremni]|uniref:ATP-binding protein n=1 Tax=Actinacidiphila epipremni TaxID=2053013 RepID=A0ABX0ZQG6_9ACTN|nr:ATP-binding protein [Actinacidiphila epipremni]NJP46173.1 ATP-binding protein [Actinacidiphila epipremni]